MMHLLTKSYKAWISGLLLATATHLYAGEPPKVLASIKPLQLIAQAITSNVSNTEVLLPPGASPHDYSLRFSDRRKLDSADLILWVGPNMEVSLNKILENANGDKAIKMMAIQGIHQHKDHSHQAEKDTKKHDHEHHHHHDHGHHHHGGVDPHIWLSTNNALLMAQAINTKLQAIDQNPEHRKIYSANLKAFEARLKQADEKNNQQLEAVRHKPFFVFHDAYGHLQDSYNLNIAGHFTLNPQQPPGAKHLEELRNKLKHAGATCVFREPQFKPTYIDSLTKGLPVQIAELDPLGENIAVDEQGYIQFINSLVNGIYNCLNRDIANAG